MTRRRLPRPRCSEYLGRGVVLLLLPLALGGCLTRTAGPTPAPGSLVATVPTSFFAATPAAEPPPAIPAGRYTLGPVIALLAGDHRASYAVPVLGQDARFVQVALRIDDLRQPSPPEVTYELVTPVGVFVALAEGEWERAVSGGGGYSEDGVLLFVVPRDLRAGRLEIVDYYYPRALPAGGLTAPSPAPLVRRVLATFALDRIP